MGIGYETAKKLLQMGARVVLADLREDALASAVSRLKANVPGSSVWGFSCDVSSEEAVQDLARTVKDTVGDIDILINNAGIMPGNSVFEASSAEIQRVFSVNVFALFWTIRAFVPRMMSVNNGHVVTIASSAGFFTAPRLVHYCSSKAAAVRLADGLRSELAFMGKGNIHHSVVCPFVVR